MRYILGIDGGGVKTICLAADEAGRVLGRGTAGPSNYLKEGLYSAKLSLRQAIDTALTESKVKPKEVKAVCAGLAGMDRPTDRRIIRQVFEELLPGAKLILDNDACIALIGATEGEPGIIAISGTGSIALGLNREGQMARSGGWGHILGDEGSGYEIARRGLMAILKDVDGRGPKTLLRERLTRELYLSSVEELIPVFYGGQMTPSRIAALYPLVLQAAEEGDEVAANLLEEAAVQLAETAWAVIRKLEMQEDRFPLAVSGGVFKSSPLIRNRFLERITRQAPQAEPVEPKHPPELGAILLAKAVLEGKKPFVRVD